MVRTSVNELKQCINELEQCINVLEQCVMIRTSSSMSWNGEVGPHWEMNGLCDIEAMSLGAACQKRNIIRAIGSIASLACQPVGYRIRSISIVADILY